MATTIQFINRKGSEVLTYDALAEAERVLQDAQGKGALVVDKDTDEAVPHPARPQEGHAYLVVPPIAGG